MFSRRINVKRMNELNGVLLNACNLSSHASEIGSFKWVEGLPNFFWLQRERIISLIGLLFIHKIQSYLTHWKKRSLSFGGRLCLITIILYIFLFSTSLSLRFMFQVEFWPKAWCSRYGVVCCHGSVLGALVLGCSRLAVKVVKVRADHILFGINVGFCPPHVFMLLLFGCCSVLIRIPSNSERSSVFVVMWHFFVISWSPRNAPSLWSYSALSGFQSCQCRLRFFLHFM